MAERDSSDDEELSPEALRALVGGTGAPKPADVSAEIDLAALAKAAQSSAGQAAAPSNAASSSEATAVESKPAETKPSEPPASDPFAPALGAKPAPSTSPAPPKPAPAAAPSTNANASSSRTWVLAGAIVFGCAIIAYAVAGRGGGEPADAPPVTDAPTTTAAAATGDVAPVAEPSAEGGDDEAA
ncbi:MAG: hypothetical protein KC417_14040, partial [Myxococcales bacterium]|nr:hypothetical protein [Myxococcales bacterium]